MAAKLPQLKPIEVSTLIMLRVQPIVALLLCAFATIPAYASIARAEKSRSYWEISVQPWISSGATTG